MRAPYELESNSSIQLDNRHAVCSLLLSDTHGAAMHRYSPLSNLAKHVQHGTS